MKTLTEFSGVVLRRAAAVRADRIAAGDDGDAVAEAVGADLGVNGDRLARLLEALDCVGVDSASIRLVRVYQGETPPPGAVTAGEFHYVVDRIAPARPSGKRSSDRGDRRRGNKGRSADRRGDPTRGGGRPSHRDTGRGGGGDRPRRGESMPSSGEGWSLSRAPRDAGGPGDRPRRPRKGPPRDKGARRAARDAAPNGAPRTTRDAASADAATPGVDAAKKRRRRRGPRKNKAARQQPGTLGPGLSALVTTPLDAAAPPRRRRHPKKVSAERAAPIRIDKDGEVDGNVALPPPDAVPDDIGNR